LLEGEHGALNFESTLGRGTTVIASLPAEPAANHPHDANGQPRSDPVASVDRRA
jgi:hypothetical protein